VITGSRQTQRRRSTTACSADIDLDIV